MSFCAPWRSSAAAWLLLLALCAAPPIRADIHIDVNGVDAQLRRNVLALLSLQRYKDRDRIEPSAVERLYNRIDDEVREALRPYGYYDPKISSNLQPPDAQRHWHVRIDIDPGVPVIIERVEIQIQGVGADDATLKQLVNAPPLHAGERLDHSIYEQYKGSLERAAASSGYLDARMLRSELQVDRTGHRAVVLLQIDTGERYYFGATTIEQSAVHASQVQRFLRYREGEPYNPLLLLRTQFALDDSQYYSTVEVEPGERDPKTHKVPILIHATNARRGYSFGLGYGTDTGVRGTLGLTVPRVNSYGHRFRVETELSQIEQLFDARYDIPFGDPALEKLSLNLVGQQADYGNDVTASNISMGPSVTQIVGRWQRVLAADYAHTVTTDPVEGRRVDNLAVPSIVFASVPEGYLGEALFTRGLYAQLLGSTTTLGARENFLRLDVQAERAFDLSSRWHLLLRTELGATAVKNIEDLPGEYRFFAGGDRSVRGFAYDDLSPVSLVPCPTAMPECVRRAAKVGGRDLITGTTELERDLPRNFGLALFVDGGNAIDHFTDPLAYSVGIGVRFRLPVVTVGLDIAQALRAPGYNGLPGPRLHLNISPKL